MTEPALAFADLTLGYNRHPAVHHLDGDVARGSLTAIVGPNGSGKSTLMKGIVGVLPPMAGAVRLPEGTYDDGLLALYGLADARERLPRLLAPTDIAGRVTEEAARETGLAAGTPVIGGFFDVISSALGAGVVRPGQRATEKGLLFTATPASDFICGTLQLAAGMNVHVFTTGRGTPYGLAEVPVIKVATRTDLARRWHDLMDVDAGRVVTAGISIEEMGWEMFRLILAVASGEKTAAERLRLANSLALFNPGPVT